MPGGGPSQARGGTLTPAGLLDVRVWYATAACRPNRLGSPGAGPARGAPARSGGMVEARRKAAMAGEQQPFGCGSTSTEEGQARRTAHSRADPAETKQARVFWRDGPEWPRHTVAVIGFHGSPSRRRRRSFGQDLAGHSQGQRRGPGHHGDDLLRQGAPKVNLWRERAHARKGQQAAWEQRRERSKRAWVMNMTSQPPSGDGLIMPPPLRRRARTVPFGGAGPRSSATELEAMRMVPSSSFWRIDRMTRFCGRGGVGARRVSAHASLPCCAPACRAHPGGDDGEAQGFFGVVNEVAQCRVVVQHLQHLFQARTRGAAGGVARVSHQNIRQHPDTALVPHRALFAELIVPSAHVVRAEQERRHLVRLLGEVAHTHRIRRRAGAGAAVHLGGGGVRARSEVSEGDGEATSCGPHRGAAPHGAP